MYTFFINSSLFFLSIWENHLNIFLLIWISFFSKSIIFCHFLYRPLQFVLMSFSNSSQSETPTYIVRSLFLEIFFLLMPIPLLILLMALNLIIALVLFTSQHFHFKLPCTSSVPITESYWISLIQETFFPMLLSPCNFNKFSKFSIPSTLPLCYCEIQEWLCRLYVG